MAIQLKEKKSTLDKVAQVVGIGQGVLGAVNTVSGLKDKYDESAREKSGVLTQKEALTAFSPDKFEPAQEGDANTSEYQVQNGNEVDRKLVKLRAAMPKMEALSPDKQSEVQARMVPPGSPKSREYAAMMPDGSVGKVWLSPPEAKKEKEDPAVTLANKLGSAPGYAVAPGAKPTVEDAKAVKAAAQTGLAAKQSIAELRELVAEHGTETFGPNRDKMQRLIVDLQLQYKDAANLGVLSESDKEMLDELVPDTTSFFQRNSTVMANLDQFEDLFNKKIDATAQARGFIASVENKLPQQTVAANAPQKPAQKASYTMGGKPVGSDQLKTAALMELQRRQGMAGVQGTSGKVN